MSNDVREDVREKPVQTRARVYLRGLQADLRAAVADLRRAQNDFAEIRELAAPGGSVTEMVQFLARADVRQAISDKDYACQRMTALAATIAAEVAMYNLLYT